MPVQFWSSLGYFTLSEIPAVKHTVVTVFPFDYIGYVRSTRYIFADLREKIPNWSLSVNSSSSSSQSSATIIVSFSLSFSPLYGIVEYAFPEKCGGFSRFLPQRAINVISARSLAPCLHLQVAVRSES